MSDSLRQTAERYLSVAVAVQLGNDEPATVFGKEVTENELRVARFACENMLERCDFIHLIYLAHIRKLAIESAHNGRQPEPDDRVVVELMKKAAKRLGVTIDISSGLWCHITVPGKPECPLPTLF